MQKTNSSPEVAAELAEQEKIKKRAAKQALKREAAPDVIEIVKCTVLPLGDGRISMGQHIGGLGTAHYEEGETFPCQLPTAVLHYVRGWVNFDGAKEAVAASKLEQSKRAEAERASQQAADAFLQSVGG